MNKMIDKTIGERTADFLEKFYKNDYKILNNEEEHEFLVLATYYRNTTFYEANKDKIDLSQYKTPAEVYADMMYKIVATPFLKKFIICGLMPVLYDVYYNKKELKS